MYYVSISAILTILNSFSFSFLSELTKLEATRSAGLVPVTSTGVPPSENLFFHISRGYYVLLFCDSMSISVWTVPGKNERSENEFLVCFASLNAH